MGAAIIVSNTKGFLLILLLIMLTKFVLLKIKLCGWEKKRGGGGGR